MAAKESVEPPTHGKDNSATDRTLPSTEDLIDLEDLPQEANSPSSPPKNSGSGVDMHETASTTTAPTAVPSFIDEEGPSASWAKSIGYGLVNLSVGNTRFMAMRHHLEKSPILKQILPPNRVQMTIPLDFLTNDAEVFEHILEYLRTGTYPFFWSKKDGFDFALYHRMQKCATLFELQGLGTWIRDQRYMDAITVLHEETKEVLDQTSKLSVAGNVEVERHVESHMEQKYICPRNFRSHNVHRGRTLICGKECMKIIERRGGKEEWEDVHVTEIVVLKKTYIFDPKVLEKR